MFIDTRELVEHGIETTGTVFYIAVDENLSYGSKEIRYAPAVEFTTLAGRTVRFQSNIYSEEKKYTVGERVEVLYDPAPPNRAKIKSGMWGSVVAFGIVGFVLCFFGFAIHKWMK